MSFRGDRRGQAVQVGAVLLFGTLVILMSLYQATVVPTENRQVEFNDYQDATGDVTALRNAMLSTAAGDGQYGTTVKTGSQYPARALFVNPPPATGQLHTGEAANITLWNVTATGDAENLDAYLGSESYRLNYSTQRLAFSPGYNEFQNAAPVVVSGGLVYRDYDEPVPVAGQTLVRGNRLTLVTLSGSLSAGGYRTPVSVEALSAHTRTVTVESRDGGPFNVTVPTALDAATWRDTLLADQLDPAGGPDHPHRYVRDVRSAGPNAVNVTLEGDATYELRVARIGAREHGDSLDAAAPDPRYVIRVGERSVSTGSDGRRKLTVEVRDRFNNPVSNANVTFNQSNDLGTFEQAEGDALTFPVRTGDSGRATVYYNATGFVGNLPVTAYIGTIEPSDDERKVRYTVTNTVTGSDGGGNASSDINPSSFVVLTSAKLEDYGGNDKRINVTWLNQGETDANISQMRFGFYFEDENNIRVVSADAHDPGGSSFLTLPLHGGFRKLSTNRTVTENSTISLEFTFDQEDQNGVISDYQPQPGSDFFVIEVVYDDVYIATYFISFEQ